MDEQLDHDNESYSVPTGDHDNDSYSVPTGCWSEGDAGGRSAEPIKTIQVKRNVGRITDTQTERSSAPVEIIQHHVRGTMNASQAPPRCHRIHAGTSCILHTYSTHRIATIWGSHRDLAGVRIRIRLSLGPTALQSAWG